jgi:hypothetical protein
VLTAELCAQPNAVVRELARLFRAFACEEEAAPALGAPDQAAARLVVDPGALREALHALDPQRFCIGASQGPAACRAA